MLQAKRAVYLPLGIKGYATGGLGRMWRNARTIQSAMHTCPSIDPPELCQDASIENDAGVALAFGFGLEFPDGKSSRVVVESQYTRGFVTDPVTYVPIRLGLDWLF